jgi:XTP/dITP diphosphohydrolase
MPTSLLVATHNPHKVQEIRAKLAESDITVVSLTDLNDFEELPETKTTFEDNAKEKALEAFRRHHLPVLADDSGICVDALQGAPGVHSKRFSPSHTDDANNRLLLERLHGQTNRAAHFVCVIAYVDSEGTLTLYRGELHGSIATSPRGMQGFGYDPLFVPKGGTKRLAELDMIEKNRLSHRAKAIEAWWTDWRKS